MEPPNSSKNPYASPGQSSIGGTTGAAELSAITCEGATDIEEYIRAARLPQREGLKRLFAFFFGLAFLFAAYGVQQWVWQRQHDRWFTAAIFAGLSVICPIFLRACINLNARYAYEKSPLANEPFRVRITSEVIETSSPTLLASVRWEAFIGFVKSEELIVLRSAHGVIWRPFFRRHFTTTEWERFIVLVESKCPRI